MRQILTVVIEATTPFSIGTSKYSELSDAPVLTDANSLPYIPGTSIAGIVNSIIDLSIIDPDDKEKKKKLGSTVLFSQGYLLDENQEAIRGLKTITSAFVESFLEKNLPVRENVAINEKGVTNKGGKFDKQIVYRGARFIFEIEILEESKANITDLKNALKDQRFRIGGKSRSGFGNFKVVDLKEESFNLETQEDLKKYAYRKRYSLKTNKTVGNNTSTLKISSENSSFLFSQGYGDKEADIVPAKEQIVLWNDKGAELVESYFLPASALKGALRHRTAFYYNEAKATQDKAENCEAVTELFGSKKDGDTGSAGKLFIDDIFIKPKQETKLNHVALDRFTQKPINGALFNEKAIFDNTELEINYFIIDKDKLDEEVEKAFNEALKDLKEGYLPIGAGVNRGHGRFKG